MQCTEHRCVLHRGQCGRRSTSLNATPQGSQPFKLQRHSGCRTDSKVWVSNLVLSALWEASQPTHRIQRTKTQSGITLIEHHLFGRPNKSLLLCGKLNGLWQTAKLGPNNGDGGWQEGEEESTISTFSNDDSKWRHGLLGCAEWYYLFGLEWKGLT